MPLPPKKQEDHRYQEDKRCNLRCQRKRYTGLTGIGTDNGARIQRSDVTRIFVVCFIKIIYLNFNLIYNDVKSAIKKRRIYYKMVT